MGLFEEHIESNQVQVRTTEKRKKALRNNRYAVPSGVLLETSCWEHFVTFLLNLAAVHAVCGLCCISLCFAKYLA